MKALVVVVVEIWVFFYPVKKILKFQFSILLIDLVVSEDALRQLLHQMMNTSCLNFHIILSHFNFERRLLPIHLCLLVHQSNNFMTYFAFDFLWPCWPTITLINFKFHPIHFLLSFSIEEADKSSSSEFVVIDGSKMFFEFFVDEILIIENFFEVFFGIIIELDNKRLLPWWGNLWRKFPPNVCIRR